MRLALVVCDLICIPAAAVCTARTMIGEQCGIDPDHVIISCTYTHTALATVPLFASFPDPGYMPGGHDTPEYFLVRDFIDCLASGSDQESTPSAPPK